MNHFHSELQYVPESITLLNMVAQPGNYITDYMHQLASQYGVTPDTKANQVVELLQEIENAARTEFSQDSDVLKYYCDSDQELGKADSLANILILSETVNLNHRSVAEQKEYLENLSEQEYIQKFYEALQAYSSNVVDDNDDDAIETVDVVDYIFRMDISDEKKLQLQQLFFHHSEHIPIVISLMLRAEKLLKKYEKKLMAKARDVISYVEKEVGGDSLSDYILQKYYGGVENPTYGKDCEVYISYLKCATMGFMMKGDTYEDMRAVVMLGVIFSPAISLGYLVDQRAQLSEEKVMAIMKLLADKSKFQILSATVDAPAYGSQLANVLGLTTATISHHTSALLEQNLLTLDKVDTKIYYRANPIMIRAIIQYLQKTLLKE